MRKLLLSVLVVGMIAAPASADLLLDPAAATPWHAPWGDPALVSGGPGDFSMQIPSNNGSAGIFWRLPAWESEIIDVLGQWQGDCGGAGWAEIMVFTSTEGLEDSVVANRMDVGNVADIWVKHDSWGLNGGPAFGPEPYPDAQMPGGQTLPLHATCNEVIVGLKVGNTADVNWIGLDYVPEPVSALLLGLPMLFIRRRR